MPYKHGGPKPSEQLDDLLRGKVAWDDAPEAIRSWAQLEIYRAAVEVLDLPTQGDRRNALGMIPVTVRPHVEARAKRLWAQRRG